MKTYGLSLRSESRADRDAIIDITRTASGNIALRIGTETLGGSAVEQTGYIVLTAEESTALAADLLENTTLEGT